MKILIDQKRGRVVAQPAPPVPQPLFMFNPILHGGGHKVPAQLEDLSWLSRGWSKKTDFSWLYPFAHLQGPSKAILGFYFEN